MKKSKFSILTLLILCCYGIVFIQAANEVGYLKLILAGLASLLSFSIANQLKIKEVVENEKFIYNPSEFPWYLALFITQFSGYALYKNVDHNELLASSHLFTLLFILMYFVIPSLVILVILINNRNDKITLNAETLTWLDNTQEVSIPLGSIKSVDVLSERYLFVFVKSQLQLSLTDGVLKYVPTYKMNFTFKGTRQVGDKLSLLLK
jgi:hypothetical protein